MLAGLRALRSRVVHLRIQGAITESVRLQAEDCLHRQRWRSPALFAVSINSASGCATQARLLRDRLRRAEEDWQCPVYCFAEDFAIGPGYLLLTAGRKVYSDANSLVGGLYAERSMWDFSGFAKSVGVTRSSLFTGKIKRVLHPLTRPIAVAWLKSILQTQHKALLSDVLSLRGGHIPRSPQAWKVLSQGQVVLGSQALETGLIDALGDVHRVVQEELPGRSIRLYEAWGEQENVPLRRLSGLLL